VSQRGRQHRHCDGEYHHCASCATASKRISTLSHLQQCGRAEPIACAAAVSAIARVGVGGSHAEGLCADRPPGGGPGAIVVVCGRFPLHSANVLCLHPGGVSAEEGGGAQGRGGGGRVEVESFQMCKPCGNRVEGGSATTNRTILRHVYQIFLSLKSPVFMRLPHLFRELGAGNLQSRLAHRPPVCYKRTVSERHYCRLRMRDRF